jgi:hypothetical protein
VSDYKKLGLGRSEVGIAKSVGTGQSTLTTGDITKGEVVTLTVESGDTSASATVAARRTGAIPLSFTATGGETEWSWSIEGTTLTLNTLSEPDDQVGVFWVF